MHITITPIGSNPTDISAATQAYVDYLCGGGDASTTPGGNDDAVEYYATSSRPSILDGAGWWSSNGAKHYDLHGRVDPDRFATMLMGRHHQTAERLISARGSAGRIILKMGTPTRWLSGRPLWSLADATSAYGLPVPTQQLNPTHIVSVDGEHFINSYGRSWRLGDAVVARRASAPHTGRTRHQGCRTTGL